MRRAVCQLRPNALGARVRRATLSSCRRWGQTPPSVREPHVSAVKRSESSRMDGSRSMLLLVVGSVAGSSSRSRRILTNSRRSRTLESIIASSVAWLPASSAAIRGRSCRMVQGCSPQGEHVASISSLFGSREGREDLIHRQTNFSPPNTISHNVYRVACGMAHGRVCVAWRDEPDPQR